MKSTRPTISIFIIAFLTGSIAFAQDTEEATNKKDEKKPKYTIKQVMEKAFKGGGKSLVTKVKTGKATDKEKMAVLDMFISLVENKPPRGELASWQKFSGAAALAAAKVAVGREEGVAEFKAATNCAKCHKAHKPKKGA